MNKCPVGKSTDEGLCLIQNHWEIPNFTLPELVATEFPTYRNDKNSLWIEIYHQEEPSYAFTSHMRFFLKLNSIVHSM
jgi:hypothetical protein